VQCSRVSYLDDKYFIPVFQQGECLAVDMA
jgi:hypothetical protein